MTCSDRELALTALAETLDVAGTLVMNAQAMAGVLAPQLAARLQSILAKLHGVTVDAEDLAAQAITPYQPEEGDPSRAAPYQPEE